MARRGKIAKLPQSIREELNQRLLDGEQGPVILPWLNSLPEVKAVIQEDFEGLLINDGNLSEWRKGGFAEWLSRREKIDRTRELAQYSVKLAKASGGSLSEGAAAMLSGQFLDVLETLDDLKEAQGAEPNALMAPGEAEASKLSVMVEALGGLTLSVARLRKGDQNAEQLQLNRERLKQAQEALELERQKFQRTTCELFLQWAEDHKAKDIAGSAVPHSKKIEQLGELMFGEDWGTQPTEQKKI